MPDEVVDGNGGAAPEAGGADAGGSEGAAGAGAASPAPGPGPWASDLERFPEDVRGDIDSYLRETWQPRVTQLEQSQMPDGIAEFLNEIQNPETSDQAFLQMAYELYGEDAIPFFETALQYAYGDAQGLIDEPQGGDFQDDNLDFEIELDPEDRAALDHIRAQREDEAYNGALEQLFEAYPDAFEEGQFERNKLAISPFVYAADGDLAEGFNLYQEYLEMAAADPEGADEAARAAGIDPDALSDPQTLGNQGGNPATPVVKQGQSLGDAVSEMLSDIRAQKGPPALG